MLNNFLFHFLVISVSCGCVQKDAHLPNSKNPSERSLEDLNKRAGKIPEEEVTLPVQCGFSDECGGACAYSKWFYEEHFHALIYPYICLGLSVACFLGQDIYDDKFLAPLKTWAANNSKTGKIEVLKTKIEEAFKDFRNEGIFYKNLEMSTSGPYWIEINKKGKFLKVEPVALDDIRRELLSILRRGIKKEVDNCQAYLTISGNTEVGEIGRLVDKCMQAKADRVKKQRLLELQQYLYGYQYNKRGYGPKLAEAKEEEVGK